MQFDDLDKIMRVYETSNDRYILPNMYIVARIDGRSFTKLTKQTCKFEAPFDIRFRDMMIGTIKHLMKCGFNILYGYTESDEISLLIDKNDSTFHRKARKLVSVLAGEASAAFSVQLGKIGAFDCRLCELPNEQLVIDYFRWRQADAHRNALNSWCYWKLREEGLNKLQATKQILGESVAAKNELLLQRGINFNNLPLWQKRGVGIYTTISEKEGYNPVTKQNTKTTRKSLFTDLELPVGKDYEKFLMERMAAPQN